MTVLQATEIKAFVPAKDFALSRRFYTELGFTRRSEGGGVAYFSIDGCAFLLQAVGDPDLARSMAEHLSMHLLVPDVRAWHRHVDQSGLAERFGASLTPLVEQPWGITEFKLTDPSGVCWRIGQNTPGFAPVGRITPDNDS